MFRFSKTLDIITLFHKASSPASVRVASLLKQASASATETATEDQASDHTVQSNIHKRRSEFELNITEDNPTPEQVQSILEYVPKPTISSIIKDATSVEDAMKKFKQSADSFQRPVVVDWNNGKAIAGDNESKILQMLNDLPKE